MSAPVLHVDLDVFAANIRSVRARTAPAELMLVVKDDAYGHGLDAIVRRAAREGVRWFGAFDVRESLRARHAAGPDARIFSWLTVGREEIAQALRADIDLGVGDAAFLEDIASVARAEQATARIHLKIDTGLHRNGIRPEDWDGALRRARVLEDEGVLRLVGVWSHIAEASDADDDEARTLFDRAVGAAEAAGFALEARHLSASAASHARPEFRYDLVRVGAFCYGVRSAGGPSGRELGIVPIAALRAPITHAADHSATLGVGSLHGLPSALARRAALEVDGTARRIAEIALVHTVIELPPGAKIGDEVTVFGDGAASATDLAEAIGTVGEEILVRISPLIPRNYRGL